MRVRPIRDKLDAPHGWKSCHCCQWFDFREMLREQQAAREAQEEIEDGRANEPDA